MNLYTPIALMVLVGLLGFQSDQTSKRNDRWQSRPPVIDSFTASHRIVTLCPYPFCESSLAFNYVTLRVNASDPDGDVLTYAYSVPVGTIERTGAIVDWNLKKQPSGTYQVGVLVEDPNGNKVDSTLTITAVQCTSCDPPPPPCPTVTVECPSEIEKGKLFDFVATVTGGDPNTRFSYTWTTDAGRIVRGKFEKKLTVDLLGFPFEKVTATVNAGGADPSCATVVSCTTRIKQ